LPPTAKTANLLLKGGHVAKKAKARDLPKRLKKRERCGYLLPDIVREHRRLFDRKSETWSISPRCLLVEGHKSEQHLFLIRIYDDSFHLLLWERDWECDCEEEWCECGLISEPTRAELDRLLGQFFAAELPSTPEE
jgi:hypothetical protein